MNEQCFTLDERLSNDTVKLASWPLSEVLLMNDRQYPWVILVPRCAGVTEIYQLSEADQLQLLYESSYLGQQLMSAYMGDKLNVAALGNVVKQLHLHHVVRFEGDISWPGPIWGKHPVVQYTDEELDQQLEKLQKIANKRWD
ncbi:HIT domain-containing protein [Alkalimarinus sediminis]|uniref:HIT domain-containing protein n=1 Tax=Alkalimarinus sediminis TaxID=1632866 RepID=A0A9E8HU72_9ALTE|nr:HIT domain-containing protein [Alkalimarinus sediminis]UZW75809.1 HIT domain-containing protein [Alkalimarinus sediminis]